MFILDFNPSFIQIQLTKKTVIILGQWGSSEIARSNLKGLIRICTVRNQMFFSNKQTHQIFSEVISGLQQGYLFQLELHGLGFRVRSLDLKTLIFKIGFSHEIRYELPNDVFGLVKNPTSFDLFGIDKKRVSQIAGEIKLLRKPDPYKGKGIRRSSDIIRLRETS